MLRPVAKPLVIVESPAKARTISGILGKGFLVESSIGHIRDLPRRASEIPAPYRSKSWARIGVDIEKGFTPLYIVPAEKKKTVTKLKEALRNASELYLATDEDREGESIAWHLTEVLSPRIPVKRMVFHEITRAAILSAVENPRDLDRQLVDAQETRRILDRLYGFEVSPVLWKKVMPKLAAGRVQSVATRLIVDREIERMRFRAAAWWDLEGTFEARDATFTATLAALDGSRTASGGDFDANGRLSREGVVVLDEARATALAEALEGAEFTVRSVEEKPWRRSPAPPFMTSTLQQEAGRKLRFTAHRTMSVAQRLYENGYITYMRTDSITLAESAVAAARAQAVALYGPEAVPDQPRRYQSKVRNAQEAHEAIRPAGDTFRTPDEVRGELRDDEMRLYELIWKRTIASEMADARGQSVKARLGANAGGHDAEFAAAGRVVTFPGFLRAYVEGADDPEAEIAEREVVLPPLAEGDPLKAAALDPRSHQTQPPARYTEASLVKALEERGIGRPSTYASIIDKILERYVWKKGTALVPSFTAFAVVTLLKQHFPDLVDYDFTARMEEDLDEIAGGQQDVTPYLSRFYYGNGKPGLHSMVNEGLGEIDARAVNSIPLGELDDGTAVVVRVGRYGPYLEAGERRAKLPEDLPPDELSIAKAKELLEAPNEERELGTDPRTGLKVFARAGRFGPYVQLGEGTPGSKEKPRTASLFRDMSLATVTFEEALELLTLPRVLGEVEGEEVVAANGRYGPFVRKGRETRSVDSERRLLTITLEEALALLAQPKQRRGRAPAPPLRELGTDPVSQKPVVLKEGRYGPYVTDGETNASLRRGDSIEEISLERAAELLQERRDRGPAPKRRRRTGTGSPKPAPNASSPKRTSAGRRSSGKRSPKDRSRKA